MSKRLWTIVLIAALAGVARGASDDAGTTITGEWIMPDWGEAGEPKFPNRRLAWFEVPNRTILYRKRLVLPASAFYGRAEVRVQTSGHIYIFVDGKEAFAHPHGWQEGRRIGGGVYDVDLTEHLRETGTHYIDISAPAEGFAITGLVGTPGEPGLPIVTDASWTVTKLPPASLIDWEPSLKIGLLDAPSGRRPALSNAKWHRVQAAPGRRLETPKNGLAVVARSALLVRAAKQLDDLEWKAALLAERGIVVGPADEFGRLDGVWLLIDPWQAYYAPAGTVDPRVRQAAREALAAIAGARQTLKSLTQMRIEKWDDLAREKESLSFALGQPDAAKRLEWATEAVLLDHEMRHLRIIASVLPDVDPWPPNLQKRMEIEQKWGAPIGRYSESRSKYGWIPNSALVGGELGDWGIRLPGPRVETRIELPRRWRFSTDPDNIGLDRAWHTVGFNIENQWREITVGREWEKQGVTGENQNFPDDLPYKEAAGNVSNEGPYNGFAWYRTHVHVPEQWRGQDVVLRIEYVDDWDWTHVNDREIGHTGPVSGARGRVPRTYVIPRNAVRFGGDNVVAIRVYDAGGSGGLGPVVLECPALAAAPESQAAVEVIRSDLSPAILLKPSGRALTLTGTGKAGSEPSPAILPLKGGLTLRSLLSYESDKDGALAENWLLVWPNFGQKELDRPLQLVFEKPPRRIEATRDASGIERVEIVFDSDGARVIAVRSVQTAPPGNGQTLDAAVEKRCRFWSRALLKYPVGFSELIRRDPKDQARREVTTVYDYIAVADDWKTEAIELAPLPVLLTYALKLKTPGVTVEGEPIDTGLGLGKYGNYRAFEGTRRLVYRYPLDRIKRLAGFTSWVFMPWDVGVEGNDRECEAVAQTGANSYRPQFNFGGEKARIFADYCAKHGLTFMFNPDNNLGKKGGEHGENVEAWVEHYRGLAEMFKDRPDDAIAYDLVNEAANMKPEIYNPLIRRLTETLRAIDKRHVIYVETCDSWGAVEKFPVLEVTGDPLTVYSFHDYNFRLRGGDRWPTLERDVRDLYARWMPAIDFMIEHNAPIHLGEFGGFERGGEFEPNALGLLDDCFRVFDQFNWHFHYYPGRGIMWPRADGSLRPNMAAVAFRRYFDRETFGLAQASE